METLVLLLVLLAAGIIGYLFMKKVDLFLEGIRKQKPEESGEEDGHEG